MGCWRRQLGGTRKPTLPTLVKGIWILLYLSIGVGFVGLQGGLSLLHLLGILQLSVKLGVSAVAVDPWAQALPSLS